jgi:hypothetical protein
MLEVYLWKWPKGKLLQWLGFKTKKYFYMEMSNQATWSMDHTLAFIVVPMLKQLKDTKHGAPFVDDEDVPEHLRSTSAPPKENEWDTDEHHFARWDWVLDEMLWAFEMLTKDDWESDYYGDWIKDGPGPLSGHFDWTDDEGRKKANARIDNGLRLFGKYFRCLWD